MSSDEEFAAGGHATLAIKQIQRFLRAYRQTATPEMTATGISERVGHHGGTPQVQFTVNLGDGRSAYLVILPYAIGDKLFVAARYMEVPKDDIPRELFTWMDDVKSGRVRPSSDDLRTSTSEGEQD